MDTIDFVKELNKNEFMNNIQVPILDGFNVIPSEETLFTAVNNESFMEQFILEGKLDNNETFDDRLAKVIAETKEAMKGANLVDVDNNLIFHKDYSNNGLDFKVYIQNNIINEKIIKQYNIYFVDNKSLVFYEVTFSSCPYGINDNLDEIASNMEKTIDNIMNKIKN